MQHQFITEVVLSFFVFVLHIEQIKSHTLYRYYFCFNTNNIGIHYYTRNAHLHKVTY